MTHPGFGHDRYVLRKKFFKLLGESLTISGPDGRLLFEANMKAFKLKEEITLVDAADTSPLLQINARSMFDISGAYDVIEIGSGHRIGALKRMGIQSMLRDEWRVLDSALNEVGSIFEDSMAMALLRRFVSIIPQSYHFEHNGLVVANFRQHFNPFILTMDLDFTADAGGDIDRRVGIAAAVLLVLIEGRQDG